jgi:hypothetical protein
MRNVGAVGYRGYIKQGKALTVINTLFAENIFISGHDHQPGNAG